MVSTSRLATLTRKTFVAGLALVGAGFIIYKLIQTYRPPPFAEHLFKTYTSPDNRFKAVQFTYDGGGALAPYCYTRIAVIDAKLPDANAADKKFQVYWGECNRVSSFPTIDWTSDRDVKITVSSYDETHLENNVVKAKGSDATHAVRIAVEIKP